MRIVQQVIFFHFSLRLIILTHQFHDGERSVQFHAPFEHAFRRFRAFEAHRA